MGERKNMRSEPVPVNDCGCKLERTETGLKMVDCPLHAAAPQLLEACKMADKFYQDNFEIMPVAWQTYADIIDAAIAAAGGEK